jgi:hypothetical protein
MHIGLNSFDFTKNDISLKEIKINIAITLFFFLIKIKILK